MYIYWGLEITVEHEALLGVGYRREHHPALRLALEFFLGDVPTHTRGTGV